MICNGNGACFNQDLDNVMCPSYKVRNDRIHSPKGRAMLLKEYLRVKSEAYATYTGKIGKRKDAQKARCKNGTTATRDMEKSKKIKINVATQVSADMVYHAMDTCLGCKGCAGKCPSGVNIPNLKTKFLAEYFDTLKKRSIQDKLLCHIEDILLFFAKIPKVWNILIALRMDKLLPNLQMVHIPRFAIKRNLISELKERGIKCIRNLNSLNLNFLNMNHLDLNYLNQNCINYSNSNFTPNAKTVVILPDVFTSFLEFKILVTSCQLIQKFGYEPLVLYPAVSGKAYLNGGMIDKFKKLALKHKELLEKLFYANIPVVSLENSISSLYNDEFKKFAEELSKNVLTLAQFLHDTLHDVVDNTNMQNTQNNIIKQIGKEYNKKKYSGELAKTKYILLPHCTEQAQGPHEAKMWQKIFNHLGLELIVKNLGCCGMSGSFGHLKRNQADSSKLFSMNWQNTVAMNTIDTIGMNNEVTQVLVTGYSCRSQIKIHTKQTLVHPVEVLDQLL